MNQPTSHDIHEAAELWTNVDKITDPYSGRIMPNAILAVATLREAAIAQAKRLDIENRICMQAHCPNTTEDGYLICGHHVDLHDQENQ